MTAVARSCTLLLFGFAFPLLSACGTTEVVASHPSLASTGDGNAAKVYFLRPDIGYTGVMQRAFTLSLDGKDLLTLATGEYALAYLKPVSGIVTVESWTVPQGSGGAMTKVKESRRFLFEAGKTYYLAFAPRTRLPASPIQQQWGGTSFAPVLITGAEGKGTAGRTRAAGSALHDPIPQVPADNIHRGDPASPPPGKTAKVSFYRGTEDLGSLCIYRILVDGQAVFSLRKGERQTLYLAPGRYWFGLELEGGGLGFMCPALFERRESVLMDGAEETYRALIASIGASPTLARTDAKPGKASVQAERAPDNALCDLGPNTTAILGRKNSLPTLAGDAPLDQWSEAYVRLAARFVASSCLNGQTLILHTEDARPLDVAYLPFLASALCLKEDGALTEVLSKSATTGEQQRGFEVRCKITKLAKLRTDLEQLENRESTESLIERLQTQARRGRPSESKP